MIKEGRKCLPFVDFSKHFIRTLNKHFYSLRFIFSCLQTLKKQSLFMTLSQGLVTLSDIVLLF